MAIYTPGKRDRRNRMAGAGKRNLMVALSLTAMVDMFTVLAVFLLQNFKVDAIKLKQNVPLPKASAIKKLEPATVVVITQEKIFLEDKAMADFIVVKEQPNWIIEALKEGLSKKLAEKKEEAQSGLKAQLKEALNNSKDQNKTPEEIEAEKKDKRREWGRVTVQADKDVDFLTVKKVLYTITEAGATLINFAVTQKPKDKDI